MFGGMNMIYSMEESHFMAFMYRMRTIDRWSLMRCHEKENVAEHTLNVCLIAHMLSIIAKEHFGKELPTEKIMLHALMHDASEIFTADCPAVTKRANEEINSQY
jgi:5'-deoxynucleotidase